MKFLLSHWFSLFTGVAFSLIGASMIVKQQSFGWLGLLFGGVVTVFSGLEIAREAKQKKVARERELEEAAKEAAKQEQFRHWVAEHSPSTPQNPIDVWSAVLASDTIEWALFEEGIPILTDKGVKVRRAALPIDRTENWVVFERGTLVVCEHGRPAADSARDILSRFDLTLLEEDDPEFDVQLAPSLGIWIVSYPGRRLFSFTRLRDDINGSAAMFGDKWDTLEFDSIDKKIIHTQTTDNNEREE